MIFKNLDGSDLTFAQDAFISFDEASHRYDIGDVPLTSVTTLVSRFFKPFDAEYWSLRKCDGDAAAARRLRLQWANAGLLASSMGTHLHAQIENFLNGFSQPDCKCRVALDAEDGGKQVKEGDISKEWAYFLDFSHEVRFTPFRAEWCVFDRDAGIAGTIDLLCRRDDGTFEIYDWKRSNKIDPNEVNRWASGLHGLEHLTDTSYVHYSLQQNLYRHILENNYGLNVSRMTLVVLHPDLPGYQLHTVPRMDEEVAQMLKHKANCP